MRRLSRELVEGAVTFSVRSPEAEEEKAVSAILAALETRAVARVAMSTARAKGRERLQRAMASVHTVVKQARDERAEEAKLTKLGFNFTPKKRYPTWEERVEQCREYKTKHGKDPVKNAEGGLGTWVVLQRHRYRLFQKGEPNRLKQNQVDRLTEVGFTWDTGIKIPESTHPRRSWDESYADLIAYKVR